MKHFVILFLASGLWGYCITVQAQSTITTASGNASGAGGNITYTVGQLVYTTDIGSTGSVAKGVQQPFEISVITEVNAAKDISLICTVYPNPANDFITLKIENCDLTNLAFKLLDVNGKVLENRQITGNETIISMTNFPPAIYILRISSDNKEIKTFKIIKK
jgi:hypothetical protein